MKTHIYLGPYIPPEGPGHMVEAMCGRFFDLYDLSAPIISSVKWQHGEQYDLCENCEAGAKFALGVGTVPA